MVVPTELSEALIGSYIVTMGLIAVAFAILRMPSGDRTPLWFGLFGCLYGVHLTGQSIMAGIAAAARWPEPGVRVLAGGLVALTWWLARNDVARRTVHQRGVTRFMAACLLGGYAWLGVGGIIAMVTGVATPGLVYDAMLHAVFLGFVMSMVFAHAPVIFPAVLGVALPYRPAFYLHVGVLHASLALRIAGDLVDTLGRWRVWGGLLNALALLLFLFSTARAIASARVAAGVAVS